MNPAVQVSSTLQIPSAHSAGADEIVLDDVEALDQLGAATGWNIEYRQLQAGKICVRTKLSELEGISVLRERANRRLEICAEAPTGILAVGIVAARSQASFNGQITTNDTCIVIPDRVESHIVSGELWDAVSMHVSKQAFLALADECGCAPRGGRIDHRGVLLARGDPNELRRLEMLMLACTELPDEAVNKLELSSELLARFISFLCPPCDAVSVGPTTERSEKQRVLRLAREYIEAHVEYTFRLTELCTYCSVSLSKLERVFREEFQMTPSAYILACRLGRARMNIRDRASDNRLIAEIAMDSGFQHLGRFSAAYRRHYGISPSMDRRV